MKIDVRILSMICATSLAALCNSAYGAESAAAAGQGTAAEAAQPDASATTEKKASARHKRKTYLNAQRNARREARQQAVAQNPTAAKPSAAAPLADLAVSFRADPRLTRSLYMGDRWFSAPSFTTVQDVERISVDVRVVGRDRRGVETPVNPEWVPADPKMVTVSPARGNAVTITVHKAGESTLRIVQPAPARTSGSQAEPPIVKEFAIRAWNQGPAIQAEITQKDAATPGSPRPTASHAASVVAVAVSADSAIDRAPAHSDAKR